ncbi:hypothetical protein ABZR08_11005 [Pseudomonas aeruginosa]
MTDEDFLKLYDVEFSDDQFNKSIDNSIDAPFGIEHFSGFDLVKVTEKSCEYPKKGLLFHLLESFGNLAQSTVRIFTGRYLRTSKI